MSPLGDSEYALRSTESGVRAFQCLPSLGAGWYREVLGVPKTIVSTFIPRYRITPSQPLPIRDKKQSKRKISLDAAPDFPEKSVVASTCILPSAQNETLYAINHVTRNMLGSINEYAEKRAEKSALLESFPPTWKASDARSSGCHVIEIASVAWGGGGAGGGAKNCVVFRSMTYFQTTNHAKCK